jgi:hypothetical protein
VRLCQATNYGYINQLLVKDSEPVLTPPPSVLLDVKLDSDEGPRPELELTDFVLSREVIRLIDLLDEVTYGHIDRIEVRAGIPLRILVESRLLRSTEVRR